MKDISVVKSMDEDIEIVVDPDVLERALENIIINATEAMQNGVQLTISVTRKSRRVRIAIQDNGTGMTDEFIRERLFKPFQTTKKHGTGLGLWQVKNIVDQIGGTIEVSSCLTEGTCFTISIPENREVPVNAKTSPEK
jgi:signal transduction histidine kinase